MSFKNFRIWRGRLPHWRADNVIYYVTFRHSRDLNETEREQLFRSLLKLDLRYLETLALCVLPGCTEMLFRSPKLAEFTDAIEKTKRKVGKKIIEKTGERFSPFYGESFDRIIRDDAEFEDKWSEIVDSPEKAELCDDSSDYAQLFVANA